MFYTTIVMSEDQQESMLKKHLLPILGVSKIVSKSYSHDDEDNIGFVILHTITGKKIEYQLRNKEPMFIEFTGFGTLRYDISYPEKTNKKMYELLKAYGIQAEKEFWKGGQI